MKLNFFKHHQTSFGLHLNGTALKYLQLEKKGDTTRILGYSNVPVSKNLIANDAILDPTGLTSLIQHNLPRPQFGHISTNRAVISVPESKSFIRVIEMPMMTEAQGDNAVMFEAEQYIPLPMDQVYFDWQMLRQMGDKMEVLIIASPKEYVDKFISVVEKANLTVVAVEVESQAVVRALVNPEQKGNLLIADLDAFKTALIMVEQGNLEFTSSVSIAGNNFTDKLAQGLSIKPDEAEKIKRDVGLANTTQYPDMTTLILPVVNDLVSEIKNILKFHYDHSEQKITQLLLSGGTAKLKHLDEFLAPLLTKDYPDIKISVADPLVKLGKLTGSALLPYEALSFTTAIGLAMRNLS